MTDREWQKISPLLPVARPTGRPRKHDLRQILNAIFYLLQSGCQWDMILREFPPWLAVYRYFRYWRMDGTWAHIYHSLYQSIRNLEGREASPSYAIIDSQSARTGAEARKMMVGFDAPSRRRSACRWAKGKKVKGRKRHIIVDTLGCV